MMMPLYQLRLGQWEVCVMYVLLPAAVSVRSWWMLPVEQLQLFIVGKA